MYGGGYVKVTGHALEYRRVRAPREDRTLLADPPLADFAGMLADNEQLRGADACDLHGRSLRALGEAARRELLAAALDYTTGYRDVSRRASERILLAGHQPELFHPGVWCKNFALSGLAKRYGAVAVNLVIDSDSMKRTSLRVPGGTIGRPQMAEVAYDQPGAEIPFEERRIADAELFASFGGRACEQMGTLVASSMVEGFWPRVVERARATGLVGAALSQSRHQLEGEWGLDTLELPQSQVCGLPSFHWFVAHLLAELPRFHDAYNAGLAEYRRANHVRSDNHPVPDLGREADWLETPLWVWSAADPRRRRLYARRTGEGLELTNRRAWRQLLPYRGELEATAHSLGELSHEIKIRSRALVTTMFARLALGDVFIHGIGGAKYDELTDWIIERFFGVTPPRYMMLSGTLLLPIRHQRVTDDDLRAVTQRLRDLTYHPESFLTTKTEQDDEARELISRKRQWITTPQTRANARERCRAIRQVNEALQSRVAGERLILEEQQSRLVEALRGESVLSSREYAFCLYPEGALRDFLVPLAG